MRQGPTKIRLASQPDSFNGQKKLHSLREGGEQIKNVDRKLALTKREKESRET